MPEITLTPSFPLLVYSYPWMPYPRIIGIYLREKHIPVKLVRVVAVSDPQDGDVVIESGSFPARPEGSLPILAIHPSNGETTDVTYIRQSSAILNFLDELCDEGKWGFPRSPHAMRGRRDDSLKRARITEVRTLAEECLVSWNPVRMFGSGAGVKELQNAAASKEMAKWTKRSLTTIERWWTEENRDLALLAEDGTAELTIADIVLYQFLEFIRTCYSVDLLTGGGHKYKDVYGREQEQSFVKLKAFMAAMGSRKSVSRRSKDEEMPGPKPLAIMTTWIDGVWKEEERVRMYP